MILLFPFTLMGPDGFYQVMRFLPAFIGAGAIVSMFFLCRPFLPPVGSLAAALVVATTREHIFRTDIMMPTALDMLLLPIFFLAMLRTVDRRKWALPTAGGLGVALLVTHPWALGLAAIPLGAFWITIAIRQKQTRKWAVPAAAAGGFTFFVLLAKLPLWSPPRLMADHAFPRFLQLMGNPGSVLPLPMFVDLPRMIGWSAMLLAAVGVVFAIVRRSRFGLLALLWAGLLLPLVLVDWFDIWYVPHRTVVYLSLGVAMLVGIALSEIVRFVDEARPKARRYTVVAALGILLVLMIPGAIATQKWYRIYDENDMAAFDTLEAQGEPFVVAGSWQGRAGYRAMTGGDAIYHPKFFEDDVHRQFELSNHPDLVVLIDDETRKNQHDTAFLHDWTLVGEWGDVQAYKKTQS